MYTTVRSQSLSSARGLAIGAYTSQVVDLHAIDWNPAGLIGIQDWEIVLSDNIATSNTGSGLTVQSIGVAKKFLGNPTLGFSYAPDKVLEFVVPATLTITNTSGSSFTANFDRQISFHQQYSIGFGYAVSEHLSVGASMHAFETNVSDTRYSLDTNGAILSSVDEYRGRKWTGDAGLRYSVAKKWNLGFAWKNFLEIEGERLNSSVSEYGLHLARSAALGVAYDGWDCFHVGVDGDTRKNARAGAEWSPLSWGSIRAGIYASDFPHLKADALGVGSGISIEPFVADLGFVHFFQQSHRSSTVTEGDLLSASFNDVDCTPFTSDQVVLSFSVNVGHALRPLLQIESVEMLEEVFPSLSPEYAVRPIAKARIRNTTERPIEGRASFFVAGLMDSPTETSSFMFAPNQEVELPLMAVFNDKIQSVVQAGVFAGTVVIHPDNTSAADDRRQTFVLVRSAHDWNGRISSLRYFVTPEDSSIIQFTRSVLQRHKIEVDSVPQTLRDFEKAEIILEEFGRHLFYVRNSVAGQDRVQYPSETLALQGGNCTDFSAAYASLLMSVGLPVAFVEVVPPDHSSDAHIYLLFGTRLEAKDAHLLTDNPKRYVIRKDENGIATVWIPIEPTVGFRGFDSAWSTGAEEYFEDAQLKLGLVRGRMNIVDVVPAF